MQWRIPLAAIGIGFAMVLILGLAWENPSGTSEYLYGYPFHWLKLTPSGAHFQWIGFFINIQLYSLLGLAVSFLAFTSREKSKLLKFFIASSPVFFVVSSIILLALSARGPYGNPFGTAFQGGLLLTIVAAPAATIVYGYILMARRQTKLMIKRPKLKLTKTLTIILIVLLSIGVADVALAFAVQDVADSQIAEEFQSPSTLDTLVLTLEFNGQISSIQIDFEDLGERLFVLNVSATAKAGVLVSSDLIYFPSRVVFTNDRVLEETIEVHVVNARWPFYSFINSTARLEINTSVKTSLNARTNNGQVIINTKSRMILNSLSLETDSGSIESNFAQGTVIAGDVSLVAATGRIAFSWNNVTVAGGILANVEATAEKIALNIKQDQRLQGNVTLTANATTNGIDLHITISSTVSAAIESSTTTGTISIERQTGFSGTRNLLKSNNYPSQSSLNVTLITTSGTISIGAEHSL